MRYYSILLISILILTGCSEEAQPPQQEILQDGGATLTIRTIDDGGWFGEPTHEVIFDNGHGVIVPGHIAEDGTIIAGGENYLLVKD